MKKKIKYLKYEFLKRKTRLIEMIITIILTKDA